ncbi:MULTISPECIES: SDR family oxidoreductase [unclassified Microbacterium]|uniref:SDR family oxidoreductase n=1 Tax=unclassified Microbacterium TaxID=2609290 RepID=UPI000C2BA5F2|nr:MULTISPECIES: SDR family oxidoreductase [unclassified Microbacterium]
MTGHGCLVVGASGVTGGAIARYLEAAGRQVIGLSRTGCRANAAAPEHNIRGDLSIANGVEKGALGDIRHVVYAAYVEGSSHRETTALNAAMVKNLLEALDRDRASVEQIVLIGGGKSYGEHLGPYRTPARESDPRLLGPILYNPQEDAIWDWSSRRGSSWTVLRPDGVIGFAPRSPMNILAGVAAFAMLSKQERVPLRFPGSPGAWDALHQATDARILAKAVEWAFDSTSARGQIFNVTNGDLFRWSQLWPAIAEFFAMPYDVPQPLSLEAHMANRDDEWDELVVRDGLRSVGFADFVSWPFIEGWWQTDFSMIQSTIKIRQAGFGECIDTHDSFIEHLTALRKARIIN